MKTFKLTVKEDLETGELGLMFNDCPVINYPMVANEGLLVAHDLLEHVNGLNKIGSIDDELEALGAVWFVRGQFGQLRKDRLGSMRSPQENIASDVLNMARIYNNGVEFKTLVPSDIEDCHDLYDEFSELINIAVNNYDSEIDEDEINKERLNFYTESALKYMLNGYYKAVEKYKHLDAYQVYNLFFDIAECVDQTIKYGFEFEGQEFVLNVDFELLTVDFNEYFEEDFKTINIEFDGNHFDFDIVNNKTDVIDQWLDENELESCNSNTEYTIQLIDEALENESDYIVIPMNETQDMTVHFNVQEG